jgi:CubicO group peptidase (beta-lactamase class C family)
MKPQARVAAAILCLAASVPAWAVAEGQDREAVTRTVRQYAGAHAFSGTVLVRKHGRTLYHESFGLADRAFNVPVTNATKFRAASITKTFTAVLILQLVEQGRLDLRAPIRTYLPTYAGAGADSVSVHNLLNHTSGIENFDQIKSYDDAVRRGIESYQLPHTTDELLARYASGRLVGPVGKAFDYNNADYVILGKIVEALDGQTFDKVLAERILRPLGMTQSGMLYQQAIVPNLAYTYMKPDTASPLINDLPVYIQNWYAAGGLYSTAADLARFADALYGSATLLKRQTLDQMLTPGLDDYGYGVWVRDIDVRGKPHRVAQRPGSIMGANTLLLRFLDDDVTVVILSNTNATDIDAFGFLVGRVALD